MAWYKTTAALAPNSPSFGNFRPPGRIVIYAALVLLGMALGATIAAPRTAEAEIPKGTERKAFLSGGARSEMVLIDIAGILTRMDGRLARIEKTIDVAAKQQN